MSNQLPYTNEQAGMRMLSLTECVLCIILYSGVVCIYLFTLFNFVKVEILLFSTNNFFVFSTSLDLASTILSLTFDLQADTSIKRSQFTTGGLHDQHKIGMKI